MVNIKLSFLFYAKVNIAKLRKEQGLTQRELAQIVGVTETTIRNWEAGRNTETLMTCLRLFNALDVIREDVSRDEPTNPRVST